MSLERSPPPGLPPPLPIAPSNTQTSNCLLCNEIMSEGQECLVIDDCSHAFHRVCIEPHLETSSECPICKRSCQLSDLRKLVILAKNVNMGKPRGKGRGAMSKQYNTRSASRNLFQDAQNSWQNLSLGAHGGHMPTPDRSTNVSTQNQVTTNPVDYTLINHMIESSVTRILRNVSFLPSATTGNCNPQQNANLNSNQPINSLPQDNINTSQTQVPSGFSPTILPPFVNNSMPADKITSVIQNWNLKFDGSSTGLSVEEFFISSEIINGRQF